jgi:hypothetical protein
MDEVGQTHNPSDDVLAMIFNRVYWSSPESMVKVVPLVCRRWRRVCKEHMTNISLKFWPLTTAWSETVSVSMFMESCKAMVNRFRSTRSVGLVLTKSVDIVLVAEIITHSDLTMFTNIMLVHECAGTCMTTLHCLAARSLPRLRTVNIRHCVVRRLTPELGPCQDKQVARLCRVNPGLERLSLDGWSFTDDALEAVGTLPRLTGLSFGRLMPFSDEAVAQLATAAPLLKASSIKSLAWVGPMTLRALGRTRGDSMRVIKTVAFRRDVKPADIAAYITRCPNAKCFVTDGIALDDSVLRALAGVTPKRMQRLGLANDRDQEVNPSDWYTPGGLMAMMPQCVSLSLISFVCCPSVTDAALAELCKVAPIKTLEVVRCPRVTGMGVAHALSLLTTQDMLRELWIEDCPTLTDEALSAMQGCTPSLRHLNIWESVGFSEQGLIHALRHWMVLEGFHVQSCLVLTDLAVGYLSLKPSIVSLDLDGAENLTDTGGLLIMQSCPNLEELSFRLCLGITDSSFVDIQCTKLRTIVLNYLHNITNKALTEITTKCPLLHQIRARDTGVDEHGITFACTHAAHLTVMLWTHDDPSIIGNVRKAFPRIRM